MLTKASITEHDSDLFSIQIRHQPSVIGQNGSGSAHKSWAQANPTHHRGPIADLEQKTDWNSFTLSWPRVITFHFISTNHMFVSWQCTVCDKTIPSYANPIFIYISVWWYFIHFTDALVNSRRISLSWLACHTGARPVVHAPCPRLCAIDFM